MSASHGDEVAKAGFNNPFGDDETANQQTTAPSDEVSPQHVRTLAEETANDEDVAPSDHEPLAAQSSSDARTAPAPSNGIRPLHTRGPDEETAEPGNVAPSYAEPLAAQSSVDRPTGRQIAFAEGTEVKDFHSEDDIEKVSTHSGPSSDETAPHAPRHEVALEKLRDTATKVADKFHLSNVRVTGPSRLFNPTNVRAHIHWAGDVDGRTRRPSGANSDFDLLWRARDNRKGRGSIAVRSPSVLSDLPEQRKADRKRRALVHLKNIAVNIKRMLTTFPYWDMAFWSGWSYTVGSALFVLDGLFAWLPTAFPETEFSNEEEYGVPLAFFIGALFFQIGGTMAYFEAINDGSFHGSAMRRLMEGHEEEQKQMLDEKIHAFFGNLKPHGRSKDESEEAAEKLADQVDPEAGWKTRDRQDRPGSIYPPAKHPGRRRGAVDMGAEEGQASTYLTWRWWPSWYALRTHHVYEIGYMACAIQLFGVTLYGVTSVIILPGILDSFTPGQELGGYWIPQMIAAACFLIASVMFTLETQEKWWRPEPKVLGWWIGFWSIVGSVGFELCAAFGAASGDHHWAAYQSNLSSTWGSTAYLIGSALQWYEALNKHPVQELFEEPGEIESWPEQPV